MSLAKIVLAAGFAPLLMAAYAPTLEPPPGAKGPGEVGKAGEVVCKKFPPPAGTRIGKRQICKTQAEWDYINQQEREALENAMRKPRDGQ